MKASREDSDTLKYLSPNPDVEECMVMFPFMVVPRSLVSNTSTLFESRDVDTEDPPEHHHHKPNWKRELSKPCLV